METETVQRTGIEQIHEGVTEPEVEVSAGETIAVEGADTLHAALDEAADGMDTRGFKCSKCGLAHSHDTNKHRVSDSSGVSESEAADMDWNPNCHCGYSEAAHRGIADVSPDRAASQAPIPDETARAMAEQF